MSGDTSSYVLPPIENPELEGHSDAEGIVLDAWNSGRFPHAWLITGPRGVGKATFAHRAARWVLAQTTDSGESDASVGLFGEALPEPSTRPSLFLAPDNGTFRRIVSGGHTDFRVLSKPEDKTQIPVDDVRKVLSFLRQTPAESLWKAVIIDSVDEMNRSGANAILKALEEPPPKTLFLLVSHAPGKLLPTIRSRCRKLVMGALSTESMDQLLGRYAPDIPQPDRPILIQLAEGSIGDALRYAEAGGIDLYRAILALLSELDKPDPTKLHGLAEMLAPKTADAAYGAFRTLLDWWLRRAIKAQATGIRPPGIVPEEDQALDRWLALGNLETSMRLWDKLTGLLAQSDPPANLDRRQLIVAAFSELREAAVTS